MMAEVTIGKRVVVPFGPKRFYSAIVYQLEALPAKGTKPRQIAYVLDNLPIITALQVAMWEWLAHYYMCGLGSVMNTALPGSMRLSSQTTVLVNPDAGELPALSDDERMVLANLNDTRSTSVDVLEKLSSRASVHRALDKLLKLGLIDLSEEMTEQVKPKTIEYLELAASYQSHKALSALMDDLVKAPRQLEAVMRFTEMSGYFSGSNTPVSRQQLMERSGASHAAIHALLEKGVFEKRTRLEGEEQHFSAEGVTELSDEQSKAVNALYEVWKQRDVAVLQGVTGSGKTIVYSEIVKGALREGRQVLYLVPEIALTTQLVQRLQRLLGGEVLVYHSRFSNRERLTRWMQMLSDQKPRVIVGARSAVFLPFTNLGLIVIDEEHEASYKQHESAPFYNARDVAIWLASASGAKVILGSATPSIESAYHASRGKYGLVRLEKRYGDIRMPVIEFVDLRKALREKQMKADFSAATVAAIHQVLLRKKQIIVFQNRRGYAPYQLCESCGWAAGCDHCDVNLTYHRRFEKLVCHYCGFSLKQPSHCPDCGSAKLTVRGFGTEKVEDDLEILFPQARIARMDLDTTRKKNAFHNIITAFQEGSVDILVGTQMVTKGLDFEHVGLVCVMNADALWNRPDFRAFERAYQLLTQVAGRAGRKKEQGKVLIQTFRPEHPVLNYVARSDYQAMFEHQLAERSQFNYPPFSRLIRFQLSHANAQLVREAAQFFALHLRERFDTRVLGPEEPPVARVRGKFIRQLFLKLETTLSPLKSRKAVWECIDLLEGHTEYRKLRLHVDVDPV